MCTSVFSEMPRKKLILVDLVNTLGVPGFSFIQIGRSSGELSFEHFLLKVFKMLNRWRYNWLNSRRIRK